MYSVIMLVFIIILLILIGNLIEDEYVYYHKSNPKFRDSILNNGLIPKVGEAYVSWMEMNGKDTTILTPYVFLTKENNYDSTYDDDIWEIRLPSSVKDKLELEVDLELIGSVKTKFKIEPKYIKLIYKGTGKSTF